MRARGPGKRVDPSPLQKHIYSSITTREVTEEQESRDKSEATYMTMVRMVQVPRAVAGSPGRSLLSRGPRRCGTVRR